MPAPRLSYANVVATLCLIALVGAGAVAAIAQTGGKQLAACYKTKGKTKGNMRFLTKSTLKCKKGEKKVSWSQTGPQGPVGARGTAGADAVAPAGAVMFFDAAACPSGWTAYEPARGRYLVGTPAGGTAGALVGTPLGDQENRAVGQHAHGVTDPGHSHEIRGSGAALRVPSSVVSLAGRLTGLQNVPPSDGAFTSGIIKANTGVTVDPAGGVAGTNAPYAQLLACKKS